MNTTKHTPGPWTTDDNGNIEAPQHPSNGTPLIAETFDSSHIPYDEQRANARLIASAPELLAACQEIIEGMIDGPNGTQKNVTMYAIQMVKSAIAKATGN